MKKPKSVFYIIYFLFHIALLAVSIYVNYRSEDFEFLLWLRERMSLMVYASILGLILFFVNMLMVAMESRSRNKAVGTMEKEVNVMKAKMFDLQEASQSAVTNLDAAADDIAEEPKSE